MSQAGKIVASANDLTAQNAEIGVSPAWSAFRQAPVGGGSFRVGAFRRSILLIATGCSVASSRKDIIMNKLGRIVALSSVFAAISIGVAMAAHAEESITVPYGDLDLNKQAGAETMMSRLKAGVDRVCGEPGHRTLAQRQQHRACSKQALDSAVAQIGAPMVSALYGQPLIQTQVALDK